MLAEADAVAARAAAAAGTGRRAAAATPRDLPFVTIDPAGSTDLDQAVLIERRGTGYRVHYAIADVASFVAARAARSTARRTARGVTLYSPDLRTSLHPPVLSEGAASLLPDVDRAAVLWRIDLDSAGLPVEVDVERALVRSRREARLRRGAARHRRRHGRRVARAACARSGLRRQELEVERGGIDVRVPDQEIEDDGPGYRLAMRAPHPVESWNAQISLLTGHVRGAA